MSNEKRIEELLKRWATGRDYFERLAVLRRELGPLLLAGARIRLNSMNKEANAVWDAALAGSEESDGK